MFEAAQSREEYYKLLAQKIYLIRKELEDRKRNKNRGTILLPHLPSASCKFMLLHSYLCTVGGQIPPMMNGGDPTHQGYPGQPPELNTAGMDSVGNIAGVPPLPDNIPSVLTALTPAATGKITMLLGNRRGLSCHLRLLS